jgi:hypothetical protein
MLIRKNALAKINIPKFITGFPPFSSYITPYGNCIKP